MKEWKTVVGELENEKKENWNLKQQIRKKKRSPSLETNRKLFYETNWKNNFEISKIVFWGKIWKDKNRFGELRIIAKKVKRKNEKKFLEKGKWKMEKWRFKEERIPPFETHRKLFYGKKNEKQFPKNEKMVPLFGYPAGFYHASSGCKSRTENYVIRC